MLYVKEKLLVVPVSGSLPVTTLFGIDEDGFGLINCIAYPLSKGKEPTLIE